MELRDYIKDSIFQCWEYLLIELVISDVMILERNCCGKMIEKHLWLANLFLLNLWLLCQELWVILWILSEGEWWCRVEELMFCILVLLTALLRFIRMKEEWSLSLREPLPMSLEESEPVWYWSCMMNCMLILPNWLRGIRNIDSF